MAISHTEALSAFMVGFTYAGNAPVDKYRHGQAAAPIQWLTPRIPRTERFGWEQQGFNECPQLIVQYRFGPVLFVTETIMSLTTI